jgi:hypothetical protein
VIDFIVLGLPRSATTWLSVWLTTERSLCLHDPFSTALPEEWHRDARRFGISCTGAYLFPKWLARHECPVAIIERDGETVDAALARLFGSADTSALRAALAQVDGRRFAFESLWHEDNARDLWAFLLPGVPFDAMRYRQMTQIQIQPHLGKWRFDPRIAHEMHRREAAGG